MQIKEGSYYRRRDGLIDGPMERVQGEHSYPWRSPAGFAFTDDGRYDVRVSWSSDDLVAEVFITDTPPQVCPELKAGGKYETVKLDGTPGPVITLGTSSFTVPGIGDYFCYSASINGDALYITAEGLCVGNSEPNNRYRITREYVEPKPPSLAERLESLKQRTIGGGDIPELHSEFASLVADVRKLEAKSK